MSNREIMETYPDETSENEDYVKAERYLTILEVSQKQAYIFASNKLADNEKRSAEIAWLTAPESIHDLINDPEVFDCKKNTVYSGGGHTVLTFETHEKAKDFNKRYSFLLRTMNSEIEVFLHTMPYQSEACTEDGERYTPSRYLKELARGLERKKSLRRASFRQGSFGVEKMDSTMRGVVVVGNRDGSDFVNRSEYDGENCDESTQRAETIRYIGLLPQKDGSIEKGSNPVPSGFLPAWKFEDLGGSFIAVVHIDGNGMGARCNSFYESLEKEYLENTDEDEETRWQDFREAVDRFSKAIDEDFKKALKQTFEAVGESLRDGKLCGMPLKKESKAKSSLPYFPIRGIIASGDDICFVTNGMIGIECAAMFLEHLSRIINPSDGKPYSASAGVAIVHQKYPFFRAYELSEQLCRKAKECASNIRKAQREAFEKEMGEGTPIPCVLQDNGAGICAMDWHLEMGEIGMTLDEIREGYLVKDTSAGKRHLEMRPYIVTTPCDAEEAEVKWSVGEVEKYRYYDRFRTLMDRFIQAGSASPDAADDVSSKLEELRGVLKQGEEEANHYINFHKLKGMIVTSYYGVFQNLQVREDMDELPLFVKTADGKERSVLFDEAEVLNIYSLV